MATTGRCYGFFFFGSVVFDAWFMTKVLSRANSFWNPGTKSLVPYSNKTTKLNVKNKKRAIQKMLRNNAMAATR